ncbi:uncharacterized protein LOC143028582 [Oratosquilla oratoria]|uniref:uncharacterized protein LOC143028582 n=1 Tax=Oratosquilla oratoria TaxID=337810 RepID=UPI003F75A97C
MMRALDATKMVTCMKLLFLVVVGVLASVVSHADSRSPIPPQFDCKYFCNVGGGRYECCDDGYPIDERCEVPEKAYVNTYQCSPGPVCLSIFKTKKCGSTRERCSGNEFCCPVHTRTGNLDFACAYLQH